MQSLRSIQKLAVRQQQRTGEVVRQPDPREFAGVLAQRRRRIHLLVDHRRLGEKCQLRGDLERTLARSQVPRQREDAIRRVEHPLRSRTIRRIGAQTDDDVVLRLEQCRQLRVERTDSQTAVDEQAFGGIVQLLDVIVSVVEEVPHFLERHRNRRIDAGARRRRDMGAVLLELFRRGEQPAVHVDESVTDLRHAGDELLDHRGARRARPDRRERVVQVGRETGVLLGREELRVEVERRVEFEQNRNRQRSLVVFELVHIARRQPEDPRQLQLGETALLPQSPQPWTAVDLLHPRVPSARTRPPPAVHSTRSPGFAPFANPDVSHHQNTYIQPLLWARHRAYSATTDTTCALIPTAQSQQVQQLPSKDTPR